MNWRREDRGLSADASTNALYNDAGPELEVEPTEFGLGAVDELIPASEDWRAGWKRFYPAAREALAAT